GLGFAGDLHQFRHAGLHTERHLELVDARVRLRVSDLAIVNLIERLQAVELAAPQIRRHTRRILDKQDRIALAAEGYAGVFAGDEAARPEPGADGLDLFLVGRF